MRQRVKNGWNVSPVTQRYNAKLLCVPSMFRLYCFCGERVYEAWLGGKHRGYTVKKNFKNSLAYIKTAAVFYVRAGSWAIFVFHMLETALLLRSNYSMHQVRKKKIQHFRFLPVLQVFICALIGKKALVESSSSASMELPQRCQEQLAKWASCQLPWLPCLWMVLLSKVAVRTLQQAAINTT